MNSEQPLRIVRNDAVDAHGLGSLNVSRFVDGVDEDPKRAVVQRLEKRWCKDLECHADMDSLRVRCERRSIDGHRFDKGHGLRLRIFATDSQQLIMEEGCVDDGSTKLDFPDRTADLFGNPFCFDLDYDAGSA